MFLTFCFLCFWLLQSNYSQTLSHTLLSIPVNLVFWDNSPGQRLQRRVSLSLHRNLLAVSATGALWDLCMSESKSRHVDAGHEQGNSRHIIYTSGQWCLTQYAHITILFCPLHWCCRNVQGYARHFHNGRPKGTSVILLIAFTNNIVNSKHTP